MFMGCTPPPVTVHWRKAVSDAIIHRIYFDQSTALRKTETPWRAWKWQRLKPYEEFAGNTLYVIGGGQQPGLSVSGANEVLEVR